MIESDFYSYSEVTYWHCWLDTGGVPHTNDEYRWSMGFHVTPYGGTSRIFVGHEGISEACPSNWEFI